MLDQMEGWHGGELGLRSELARNEMIKSATLMLFNVYRGDPAKGQEARSL